MPVIAASDNDFEQLVTANQNSIVKYYADWCGTCRLFAPKFKRLSEDSRFSGVTFLEVNAENSPVARKTAGVNNLPFIAVFKDGKLLEGAPTGKEEAVVELLNKLS